MKLKKMLLFLSVLLLLPLISCETENTKNAAVSPSDSSRMTDMSDPSGRGEDDTSSRSDSLDFWNPEVIQRQILSDEGSMCGVVYLGYVEPEATDFAYARDYYRRLFVSSGYADLYDFLLSMPDDHLAATPLGQDLYLLIPLDVNAHVTVNYITLDESNDFAPKVEKVLYAGSNGAPFLLKANYSDIFPDSQVVIEDSDGKTLTWSPMLSLRDGRVSNTTEDGQTIHDFTIYPESFEADED